MMVTLLVLQAAVWSQNILPDPQGVYLDGEGALRRREKDADDRLAEIRKKARGKQKEGDLCFVSLPRVLAEARKCVEAGRPIPDHLRYLGGLVKLKYIFVYPESGDLIIAGPSEPYDTKVPYRPLGQITGRPVLHLDDLVVALRAAGPGRSPQRIGCDIEVTREIVERCQKKLRELSGQVGTLGGRKVANAVADAGGLQSVKYYSIDETTRFAFVCVEADYKLKELALGLIKSPVAEVKSYNSLLTKPERHHRFSLDSDYEALIVGADGNAFELRGPSLKVNSGPLNLEGPARGEMSEAAKQFMNACNKHFEKLAANLLSWSDLSNLSDLTVLAALIAKDSLHERVKWDLAWVLDPKGYPVRPVPPVKTAHRLCNYNTAGNMMIFTHGGVLLNPLVWVEKRVQDSEARLKLPPRPEKGIWVPTRTADK